MEIDLQNKCRVCLCDEKAMHYIFDEFDQGITLQEILNSTSKFEIQKDDRYSPFLCQSCTSIIVDFYNLITIYNENDKQINALLENVACNEDEIIIIKPKETDSAAEEFDEENSEENEESAVTTEDEDYITIKVESSYESEDDENECLESNIAEQHSIKQEIEDNPEEFDQNGMMEDEVTDFLLEDNDAPVEYEYQEINTYTCPECEDCFLHKCDIQEHLATKHNVTEINFEELSEVSFLKIKKDNHNSCTNACKICNQTFQTIQAYSKHLDSHKKKNVCDVCGMGFIKKAYLRDHQEIHCPEKKHICNFCNKAFRRRTVLVKHKRIHTHPRECICEICGKAFNDKGTLKTHITLLHVKERNFDCLICGVKFPLKSTLDKHIRRHQNKEREFFCTQCPLGYRDKSSLDRHIFVKHSGRNVKSTCSECGKQYTTASSLLKHQRTAHGTILSINIEEGDGM